MKSIEYLLAYFEEQGEGYALISDDFGSWAISGTGVQNIPENPPDDLSTSFFVSKYAWKPTIREALEGFYNDNS